MYEILDKMDERGSKIYILGSNPSTVQTDGLVHVAL